MLHSRTCQRCAAPVPVARAGRAGATLDNFLCMGSRLTGQKLLPAVALLKLAQRLLLPA